MEVIATRHIDWSVSHQQTIFITGHTHEIKDVKVVAKVKIVSACEIDNR